MSKKPKSSLGGDITCVIAVLGVFALAILMIMLRYDAAAVVAVVTGTSVAAARLVHRLRRYSGELADGEERNE